MGSSPDTCLCGIDVDKAAHMIAVKSFILAIISGAALIVQICLFNKENDEKYNAWYAAFRNLHRYFHHYWLLGVQLGLAVILGIVSILLWHGHRIRNKNYYYPFLFNSAFEVLVWLASLTLFILSSVKVADGKGLYVEDSYRDTTIIIMIIFIVFTSLFAALRAYLCIIVIYRAKCFLERGQNGIEKIPAVVLIVPEPKLPPPTQMTYQAPHFHSFFFLSIRRFRRANVYY